MLDILNLPTEPIVSAQASSTRKSADGAGSESRKRDENHVVAKADVVDVQRREPRRHLHAAAAVHAGAQAGPEQRQRS